MTIETRAKRTCISICPAHSSFHATRAYSCKTISGEYQPCRKCFKDDALNKALFPLSSGAGAVLDTAIGPYSGKTGSEHALFREFLGSIAAGDLILADRYYCAYFVIALPQQHQRRHTDFRKGRRLGSRIMS